MACSNETPEFQGLSRCCFFLTMKAAWTFWPKPIQENGEIPEETLQLALKWFQTRFTLNGFKYKVSKKTNYLTLLQLLFTDGVKGAIMKSTNETEDNMQTALMKDGQYVAFQRRTRVDGLHCKRSYLDQNRQEIFSFLLEFPREYDMATYENGSKVDNPVQ